MLHGLYNKFIIFYFIMPTKLDAARHRRSKASVTEWNQFSATHRNRALGIADFANHPHTQAEYEQNIHPPGHPAHSSNIRRLVTYVSKNNTHKDCRYGTYRDGQVLKCLRNPLHAPAGASHKRGAHTGNPIGRPREEEAAPPTRKRRRNTPPAAQNEPRRSPRLRRI